MAEHRVEIRGTAISYRQWAPDPDHRADEAARTVLLLHGAGMDCAQLAWGHLGPRLAEAGVRVVAPDLPGFGETPAAGWPATQENLLTCVERFVDALGLDDIVVGGTSMGGGLGLGYGLRHPERVRGLVLVSSAGIARRVVEGWFSLPVQALTRLMVLTGVLDVGARWRKHDHAQLARSLAAVLCRPGSVTDEVVDVVMREVRLGRGSAANREWQSSEMRWTRVRTDYTADLPGFAKPVLVLHGSKDSGVPRAAAERAARLLPRATLTVVDGAGHWLTRDAADEVLAATLEFLDSACPAR
ncbi:alpha/beta hydrolase [Actinomycetes bacterium KLBMP 9759]